jgi:parvulin-like peptidyl-prolyl isomerase
MIGKPPVKADKDPIVEATFSMKKGEISEPIRTTTGYVILIVDDIQEVNKRTYEEAYEGMKKYILEAKNEKVNERARAYMDTLWARQNATWNEETIDTLTTWFRQWKKGHDQLILIDSLRALPEDFKNRMVFTSKEQNFSVADLLAYYKKSLAQYSRLAMENKSSFKRVLVTDLRYRLLEDQAMRDRLDQDEKLIRQIKEKFENELINKKRSEIQSKVQPTEEELKARYEANKASKYMTPKQVEIQEILVRSENLANELLQRIKAGENFGTLAEKYTLRKGQKEKKGMIAPFGKGAMGAVGEKAFQMAVGEIAGPIPSTDNKQAIIKLIDIKEPEPRPYADVASIVRRDFINDVRKNQITDWAAEQKETRSVYINEKLVESIWKTYASKK